MASNPSDLLRGLPGFVPLTNKVGGDNPQVLTGAKGGSVPTVPGRLYDSINSGPAPAGTRESALHEARRRLENDPSAIVLAEQIAMGIRVGLATNGMLAFDPNLEWANARAEQFDLRMRGVVVPPNADAEQTAAADLIEEANRNPTTFASGSSVFQEWVRIAGAGEFVGLDIEAGRIAVVDQIGITTWSLQAEDELVWALGTGFAQVTDATQPQSARTVLVAPRRGWPFATADDPAHLNGLSRISNPGGSPSNTVRMSLMVRFLSSTTPVKSSPHYVEVTLRGWKVPMGRDNRPVSAGLGGADLGNPSPERT